MQLEQLVEQAISGDKVALEGVVASIQDEIYYLSLRMLVNPDDAKDATQEILIKVITKLSTFEFRSAFKTWVYRVATNYLLNNKKVLSKDPGLTFDMYKADLESDLADPGDLKNMPEYNLLINEVRTFCTIAMLLCLKQNLRLAYILGDIFELEHKEASEMLNISKENYRKQLSRARAKVTDFTASSCGLVSSTAKCSCEKKLQGAMQRGRVMKNQIIYSTPDNSGYAEIQTKIRETREDLRAITLQNAITSYKSPEEFCKLLSVIVES